MRARIDSTCAGFLLTNGVSYSITFCAMIASEKSYLADRWVAVILGAVLSLGSGIYLFLGGRHSRIVATIACVFFLISSVYIFSTVRSHGFPPPWSNLFSPVPVCSALCLVFLFFSRDEKNA
jgi:hypothetical protein